MSPIVMVEVAVLGVLALAALGLGIAMAVSPRQRRYEMLRPVTLAILFGCLWTSGTGLTNMLMGLARQPWSAELAPRVFAGLAELLVPSMIAMAVLTVAWGLMAIGVRKLD
jgi:hypothetical protein